MKEDLYKKLDSIGVKYDKRWNAEKLQKLLDESHDDDAVVGVPVVAHLEGKPKKEESLKIIATFKVRSKDGDRIVYRFVGEGSLEEAVNLVCEQPEENEGHPWPKGAHVLTNVKVKKGDYVFDRALAPHVARSIFEDKNIPLLRKLFGL